MTNTDNDTAGITVTPDGGPDDDRGRRARPTFTVVLTSQPTANVTIGLTARATRPRGRSRRPALTFTPANWNMPQTVTVTGVDDSVDDGDIAYTIVTAAAVSARPGLQRPERGRRVGRRNTDNDTAGITVTPTSGLTTTEAGGTADVHRRADQPADGRRDDRPASSRTRPRGRSRRPALTFTPANWNVAADGDGHRAWTTSLDDGDIAYTIVTAAAASADAELQRR